MMPTPSPAYLEATRQLAVTGKRNVFLLHATGIIGGTCHPDPIGPTAYVKVPGKPGDEGNMDEHGNVSPEYMARFLALCGTS